VKKFSGTQKYPAKVLSVAHDCDLVRTALHFTCIEHPGRGLQLARFLIRSCRLSSRSLKTTSGLTSHLLSWAMFRYENTHNTTQHNTTQHTHTQHTEYLWKIANIRYDTARQHLQDTVAVVGYPTGGDTISVTRGVVSRIEPQRYAHGTSFLPRACRTTCLRVGSAQGSWPSLCGVRSFGTPTRRPDRRSYQPGQQRRSRAER
jgi:hypothetical protein